MATQPNRMSVYEFYSRYGDNNDELIDGMYKERGLTGLDHNDWMVTIRNWFHQHRKDWNVDASTTYDVIFNVHNKLVPDVVVFDLRNPREQYLTHLPIAIFEVTSPRDEKHPAEVLHKLSRYEAFGVPEIWQVYPKTGKFKRFSGGVLTATERFEYQHIHFCFSEIEALLDGA